jgi:hypothetical protein
MQIRAAQQSPELRNLWMKSLTGWTADQLIFIDESAANERTGDRKYGWAPVGVTPHVSRAFKRSERWSLLPAYTVDGFITWEILQGSFTAGLFENFIENKVLPLCNPYPLPHSIIVMDNAPIHQSDVREWFLISLTRSGWFKCARKLGLCFLSFRRIRLISTQLKKRLPS